MRIVDRATFLQLPPGTLYAKFGGEPTQANAYCFGSLCIKDDARGDNDWWHIDTSNPNLQNGPDTAKWIETIDRMLAGGEEPVEWDTIDSDGLYDDGQLFAVYSCEDAAGLIARLQEALAQSTTLSEA